MRLQCHWSLGVTPKSRGSRRLAEHRLPLRAWDAAPHSLCKIKLDVVFEDSFFFLAFYNTLFLLLQRMSVKYVKNIPGKRMSQTGYIHAKYGCQCCYTITLAYCSDVSDKNSVTDATSLKFQEKHSQSLRVTERQKDRVSISKELCVIIRGEAHSKTPSDLTNKSRHRERTFPQTRDVRHQVEPLDNPALSTGIRFNRCHLFVRAAEWSGSYWPQGRTGDSRLHVTELPITSTVLHTLKQNILNNNIIYSS